MIENTPPKSRAERRRDAREAAKSFQGASSTASSTQRPQWPLWLAAVGFLFVCSTMALVWGLNLWAMDLWLSKMVGWAVVVVATAGSFEVWRRFRSRFAWRKRWALLLMAALIVGVGSGIVWASLIERWQTSQQFDQFLDQHHELVAMTQEWTAGQRWNAQQCQRAQTQHDAMLHSLFRGERPPQANETMMAISVQQVLYQAGCEDTWKKTKQFILAMPAQWQGLYPRHMGQLRNALNQQWPDSARGCQMEYIRNNPASGSEMERAFTLVCRQANIMNAEWKPGAYTTQAQQLSEELGKMENKKAP